MLVDRYQKTMLAFLQNRANTQREVCLEAGRIVACAAQEGRAVHVFDSGHIINSELIERGGGLILFKPFKYALSVTDPVRPRDRSDLDVSQEGLARYALRASGARPGDVIFIGSVSGKTVDVVDLAIEAKAFGLTVIAVTSLDYSGSVCSLHSSGKRLFECADLVLDNGAPVGEGMLEVPGLNAHFAAASGLSAAFLMWSVSAVAVELLLEQGCTPGVFRSYNLPGGEEHNETIRQNYLDFGF